MTAAKPTNIRATGARSRDDGARSSRQNGVGARPFRRHGRRHATTKRTQEGAPGQPFGISTLAIRAAPRRLHSLHGLFRSLAALKGLQAEAGRPGRHHARGSAATSQRAPRRNEPKKRRHDKELANRVGRLHQLGGTARGLYLVRDGRAYATLYLRRHAFGAREFRN